MAYCRSVGSESTLVRVQAGWDDVSNVLKNQFFIVFHRGESQRLVVSTTWQAFLGTGTMVAVLKQVGTLCCDRNMLKMTDWHMFFRTGRDVIRTRGFTHIHSFRIGY